MDSNNTGNLEDDILPTFMDHLDFQPSIDQNWCLLSQDGHFDSSFSSSTASYDGVYTPLSSNSLGLTDIDGFSACISLGSKGSTSSVGIQTPYDMKSVQKWVKKELDSHKDECVKVIQGQLLWSHHDSYVDDMYEALGLQDDFSDLSGIMFDNPPELLFDDASSPIRMYSSPNNFVVPSQTFNSELYRPTTPKTPQRDIVDSPLEHNCRPDEAIKYFMSPREPQLQTPSPGFSSGSPNSAVGRKSLSKPLQSSAALHRVQSIAGPRIMKPVKGTPSTTSKIDCVTAGTFKCNYLGCKSVHGFKRHEHLKRHQKTHGDQKTLVQCDFCPKKFPLDRMDNFKSHVILHSENKPGSRTKYCPEAVQVVESWKKRKEELDRKLKVMKEMYNFRPSARRPKAASRQSEY